MNKNRVLLLFVIILTGFSTHLFAAGGSVDLIKDSFLYFGVKF
jgi:hypothetical protein